MIKIRALHLLVLTFGFAVIAPNKTIAKDQAVQTSENEESDTLQKKWRKKKKIRRTLGESLQKVVYFDWDLLDSQDEKNLAVAAIGASFICTCLYIYRPTTLTKSKKTSDTLITTLTSSTEHPSSHTPSTILDTKPSIEPITSTIRAINEKRAFQIKAFDLKDGKEVQQQSGNYWCGFYAAHNAATVLELFNKTANANLYDITHGITQNQTTLNQRLDYANSSLNPRVNWMYTVCSQRRMKAAKLYIEHLLKRSIIQSPEEWKKLTFLQRMWFTLFNTFPRTFTSHETGTIKIIAEILAHDIAQYQPIALDQLASSLQNKYDTLNPQHKALSWYTEKIHAIQGMLKKTHLETITELPQQIQVISSFLQKAASYTRSHASSEPTDFDGSNLDSGEVSMIIDGLEKLYNSELDTKPNNMISVFDTLPTEMPFIQTALATEDNFSHAFVIRTGNARTQTAASSEALAQVARAQKSIETKYKSSPELAQMTAILEAIQIGRITSISDNAVLTKNFKEIGKNTQKFNQLFGDVKKFKKFVHAHSTELNQFMTIFKEADSITAQGNAELQAQATAGSTHWICCVVYRENRNAPIRYYVVDSMNMYTQHSSIIKQLINLIEPPIESPVSTTS